MNGQSIEPHPISAAMGTGLRAVALLPAAVLTGALLQAPALAGSLIGSASYRERIALPPDAVFEAVLTDAARADAPARELGRARLQPAGQPPFRFSIPYREGDLRPGGRYAVRATVRQGERLLLTSDTHTPVLTNVPALPLQLQMVAMGKSPAKAAPSPLGRLPASWRGDLPAAGGTTRWQLDLAADGSYQLRQTFLNRPAPNSFDDIGRWRLEPGSNRLVLRGGREAPVFFQPLDGGARLRKLNLEGKPIPAGHNVLLRRLAAAEPIEPRLHLLGMVRYQADAARIRLCATGASLPVAMEGDYQRLEKAYLKAQGGSGAGQPLLVNLDGLIGLRPSAEPFAGKTRTLVVERFVGIHPGRGCPRPSSASPSEHAPVTTASLRGTLWRLMALQDGAQPTIIGAPARPPELQLASDGARLSGSGGCNRLMGGLDLSGDRLRFTGLATTRMACPEAVMALEQRYLAALEQVRRWRIDNGRLQLQNEHGLTLLLFEAGG